MFSLILVQQALIPSVIDARSRLPGNPDGDANNEHASLPYLQIAGSPPLRFRATPPPLDLTGKPPAAGSPHPTGPAKLNAPEPETPSHPAEPAKVSKDLAPEEQPAAPVPVSGKPVSNIIPDDTHPATRPEDFLPFFQYPGANNDVIVTPARPPTPGQLPPSSATYQQR